MFYVACNSQRCGDSNDAKELRGIWDRRMKNIVLLIHPFRATVLIRSFSLYSSNYTPPIILPALSFYPPYLLRWDRFFFTFLCLNHSLCDVTFSSGHLNLAAFVSPHGVFCLPWQRQQTPPHPAMHYLCASGQADTPPTTYIRVCVLTVAFYSSLL